jgi:hypothetical protein
MDSWIAILFWGIFGSSDFREPKYDGPLGNSKIPLYSSNALPGLCEQPGEESQYVILADGDANLEGTDRARLMKDLKIRTVNVKSHRWSW